MAALTAALTRTAGARRRGRARRRAGPWTDPAGRGRRAGRTRRNTGPAGRVNGPARLRRHPGGTPPAAIASRYQYALSFQVRRWVR